MPVLDSIRKRFSHQLESYNVDDDYDMPSRASSIVGTSHRSSISSNSEPPLAYQVGDTYCPTEEVPSYELSQLLHEHQMARDSVVNSTNVSRTNSFARLPEAHLRSFADLSQTSSPSPAIGANNTRRTDGKRSLKKLGLKFLNAKQHFLLACCRDVSLMPCLIGLIQSWRRAFLQNILAPDFLARASPITKARASEHFLTGVWCIVAGYLSYSVLDGLMVRWIVTYLTAAAIVRMLSMSVIIITIEQYLVATFSAEGYKYGLHIWILISCCLTITYIVQNFVTSNLDLKGKRRARFFDFYTIAVFAVVPVGMASFITMIGLLRSLLILRLDIDLKDL